MITKLRRRQIKKVDYLLLVLYLEHPNNQNQPEIPNHKPLIDNTF